MHLVKSAARRRVRGRRNAILRYDSCNPSEKPIADIIVPSTIEGMKAIGESLEIQPGFCEVGPSQVFRRFWYSVVDDEKSNN